MSAQQQNVASMPQGNEPTFLFSCANSGKAIWLSADPIAWMTAISPGPKDTQPQITLQVLESTRTHTVDNVRNNFIKTFSFRL